MIGMGNPFPSIPTPVLRLSSRLDLRGCGMIEKNRRKKKPRRHPHFVWADPEQFYV